MSKAPTAVKSLRFYEAFAPLHRPLSDAMHTIQALRFLIAEVQLYNGRVGQGYLIAFHYSPNAIRGALRDLESLVVGLDSAAPGLLLQRASREHAYFGGEGLQRWAVGVVNIAMWDAWARTLDVSMHNLFGTQCASIPCYGSGGWLSYSDQELVDEVTSFAQRGFRAVKIRVGSADITRDAARLRKVRHAVGPSVRIIMDGNEGLQRPDALMLARVGVDVGVVCFEQPLHHRDYGGYEALRSQAGLSLAMGEREYDVEALKALVQCNGIDMWQPDLMRLGGVENWRASTAFAAAHHLGVLPHHYRDYDVPLLCGTPNGMAAESFDWIDTLIDTPMHMEHGNAFPRQGPGWGFRFKEDALFELH
jgi:L-alanine-DL-glutamate epimerase-like enolase superfamily enzyme